LRERQICALTDAVKDTVYAIIREAVNLVHEVELPVIDREHEADSLGGVQPRWHRNQFTLRQADEVRVRAGDRQRGNDLAWFSYRAAGAERRIRHHGSGAIFPGGWSWLALSHEANSSG
jgi:hypothetical protein